MWQEREKERPEHWKEKHKSNQNLSPWIMHMLLFWSHSVLCFPSFNILSGLDSVFFFIYLFLFFLCNDWVYWRLTNIYRVWHSETRACCDCSRETCTICSICHEFIDVKTTLTSLACQKIVDIHDILWKKKGLSSQSLQILLSIKARVQLNMYKNDIWN